jgi:ATP-dependent DNA helicase RecG
VGVPPATIRLTTPIEAVNPTLAPALHDLGVTNVGQLIAYLPMRHEVHEAEAPIGELVPGRIVSARGEITATRTVTRGRRPRFEAVLMDPTGRLDLVWFNQPYLRQRLHPGVRVRVQGEARRRGPGIQLANPLYEVLRPGALEEPSPRDGRMRPVYPASETIDSRRIESLIRSVLPAAVPQIEDHLPESFRRERHLPSLADAYRMMHAPESEDQVRAARRRLAYDELLLLQLGVQMKRAQRRDTLRAPPLRWSDAVDRRIRARFPFALTAAQEKVVREIVADLARTIPANRLIQGDVGSGKTVVALYAMLLAAASGHQAALMAPTELLAEQHFLSISRMLEGSRVRLELLTSDVSGRARRDLLARIASGDVDLVIGTHALLSEGVEFRSLAVAIIDEQHRFGVHQRASLRTKGGGVGDGGDAGGTGRGASDGTGGGTGVPPVPPETLPPAVPPASAALTPHVLVMTATPIPRTLALTVLGDLDVSTIDQVPPGRTPIMTRVVSPAQAAEVYRFVRARLDQGDQAYIVVPAIGDGDGPGALDSAPDDAAEVREEGALTDLRSLLRRLEDGELAGKRLAAIHGRLKRDTREQIMGRFREGLIDALVATTVIEVGVDVPNATVMVIEHADRFGLAQLHQLRGRVGRGAKPSVCILIGEPTTPDAAARLQVMAASTDGFELAEKDLEIRGPGEVFGLRQAGVPPFKVASLTRDLDLLSMARRDATGWIARSPALAHPDESLLRRRLLRAHGKWLGLGDVG